MMVRWFVECSSWEDFPMVVSVLLMCMLHGANVSWINVGGFLEGYVAQL